MAFACEPTLWKGCRSMGGIFTRGPSAHAAESVGCCEGGGAAGAEGSARRRQRGATGGAAAGAESAGARGNTAISSTMPP